MTSPDRVRLDEDLAESTRPYGYIYLVQCTVSGKGYVGQTTLKVAERWKLHQGNKRRTGFSGALAKYGSNNFIVKTLDQAKDQEELNLKEIQWITTQGTLSPQGYNLMSGGQQKGRHSQETRQRMSLIKTGKKASEESRGRMRAAQRGRSKSPEHIEKMRQASLGKKASPETKAKMSKAKKGRELSTSHAQNIGLSKRGKKFSKEACERIRVGCSKRSYTPEMIAKRNDAIRAAYAARGTEIAEKIASRNSGRKLSPETKAKQSISALKRAEQKRNSKLLQLP